MKQRSTADLLLVMIAGTVCFSIVLMVITQMVLQFIHPEEEFGFGPIANVINTLISLLAGFLAGRTGVKMKSDVPVDNE
jgi:hypothetical protein